MKKKLDELEERFYGELDEDIDELIPEIRVLHNQSIEAGAKALQGFKEEIVERFGGAYIPYLFWVDLAAFLHDPETRGNLFELIRAFAGSGFEEHERKKMKSLLITYFALEKEFELDKIQSLVIEKAHVTVQEYFHKLLRFVDKNETSVNMYIEKFQILSEREPDFELMKVPLVKLKERLAEV